MKVFYLCDGKGCDRRDEFCMNECRHTSDKTHALNGPCANPEENPRFVEVEPGVYAERDEALMAFIARRQDGTGN